MGNTSSIIFQFHKGTIKTFTSSAGSSSPNYFNSIKVRLKLGSLLHRLYDGNFNSIKVRLKHSLCLNPFLQVFQTDFNSIKVRLKLNGSTQIRMQTEFQFHKGTIKTIKWYDNRFRDLHFNSIKVRLKQDSINQRAFALEFQFHKGTIKTR